MALTYIGSSGGLTQFGNVRKVFYSNSAARLIRGIMQGQGSGVAQILEELRNEKTIKQALKNQEVARRYEDLIDLVSAD